MYGGHQMYKTQQNQCSACLRPPLFLFSSFQCVCALVPQTCWESFCAFGMARQRCYRASGFVFIFSSSSSSTFRCCWSVRADVVHCVPFPPHGWTQSFIAYAIRHTNLDTIYEAYVCDCHTPPSPPNDRKKQNKINSSDRRQKCGKCAIHMIAICVQTFASFLENYSPPAFLSASSSLRPDRVAAVVVVCWKFFMQTEHMYYTQFRCEKKNNNNNFPCVCCVGIIFIIYDFADKKPQKFCNSYRANEKMPKPKRWITSVGRHTTCKVSLSRQ